jgi:hypothetical protein
VGRGQSGLGGSGDDKGLVNTEGEWWHVMGKRSFRLFGKVSLKMGEPLARYSFTLHTKSTGFWITPIVQYSKQNAKFQNSVF